MDIIVVCNRCIDKTANIAKKHGTKVIFNEDGCIAKVRNASIFAASGDVIVTIDCDNRMTKALLKKFPILSIREDISAEVHLSALRDTPFHCIAMIFYVGCLSASQDFTAVYSGQKARHFEQ